MDPRHAKLKAIMHLHNAEQPGVDSTKRSIALEILAGPPDTWQTDRLCRLALAVLEARELGRPHLDRPAFCPAPIHADGDDS